MRKGFLGAVLVLLLATRAGATEPATQPATQPAAVGAPAPADAPEAIGVDDTVREEDPADAAASRKDAEGDAAFGPELTIDRIVVIGNARTGEKLIRRALTVHEGDRLRAGDPRFTVSRFHVMALGYFADVELHLDKGSARGHVILTVDVEERGTFILNRLWFGTSEATPLWLGFDVGDQNFLGSGLGLGAAFVWARRADLAGAADQWALRLRYEDPSVLGAEVGVHAQAIFGDASEPVLMNPTATEGTALGDFRALRYGRLGGAGGVSLDVTRLSSVLLDGRVERIDVDDGTPLPVTNAHLGAGATWLTTVSVGFARDTRPDPVLPYDGDRLLVVGEAGLGDYSYGRVRARWERWFPLSGARHVVSVHLGGGAVFGDAPLFDFFYAGDLNPLLPPRALDLTLSTRAAPDLLGTGAGAARYGRYAGSAALEYSYRLFRRRHRIYGGDLFAGVGAYAMKGTFTPGGEGANQGGAGLPLALDFDLGLRLDTEIGIFELSLANALGRLPF